MMLVIWLCFFLSFFFYLGLLFTQKKNHLQFLNAKKKPKFCILIPARNESQVISGLLESIQKQTRKIPMKDVYVIVEQEDDPTVSIVSKWGGNVIVRKHLALKSKGYALSEGIAYLLENHLSYDAYFIFDADNILDPDYLFYMEQDYQAGYAISTGYRCIRNPKNKVAVASGLIYFFINEWMNLPGLKYGKNILLSGTGFYIHGDYIQKWQDYPFHSLTEDVELSYYATLEGMSTHYNRSAIFYDEQPTTFQQSCIQRKRWVSGYFHNYFHSFTKLWKKLFSHPCNFGSCVSMLIGILPIIFFLVGYVLILLVLLGRIFFSLFVHHVFLFPAFFFVLFMLFLLYFALFLITYFLLLSQRDHFLVSPRLFWQTLWYHPIFLASYVLLVFQILIHPDVKWDAVVHHGDDS